MTFDSEFRKNLIEKLLNLKKKNVEGKRQISPPIKETKDTNTDNNNTNTEGSINTSGGANTPIPGTPEIREKQIQDGIQNEKITTEEKRNETLEGKRNETSQKEVQIKVGDELITIPLADFKQLAAELGSEKASQVKQIQCSVAEPSRPMLKITKPTPIPVPGLAKSLAGALVIAAFPVARKYFKKVNLQRKKEKINENVFFFVNTNVLIQGLEIGDSLVATESCDMLNAEFELDPKIEQFMIGEVTGIIDETIYQITVRVYPNKHFIYTADRFFLTPFVLLEEVKSSNWPKFDSQLIKRVSRQLIEKAYVKLKNSKRFKKISDFLNSDSLKR